MSVKMKPVYETTEEFKEDMIKLYSFLDIAEIMGWTSRNDLEMGKIRCPFHADGKERTPSCQIGDHFFRCYSCDKKGDIFTFGMLKENKSFPEIVYEISKSLGCSIKDKFRISEKQKMMAKLRTEWNMYVDDLKSEIKKNESLSYRVGKLFPIECGYNKKENRVVVPYTGINGEIYGFTQRAISDTDRPKWKHSFINETLTDNCANMIGIQYLNGYKDAYIVEGPGDISGMRKAGFANTAALGGTSNYNRNVLDYLVNTIGIESITLVMDGDEPGKEASIKNARFTILNYYFLAENSYIVELNGDRDPGDYGSDELESTVNQRKPMIEWFLSSITKQQLAYLFRTSSGKMIRNDIVRYVMETYNVAENECMRVLMSSKDDYIEDDKKKLEATFSTAKDFMQSDIYKNMSPEKAKSILKRKYGIVVD